LDNGEQSGGGYTASERVRFCTTAFVDPDLGPTADPTYTLAPESTTSMHGSTALAQRKGCHPYGIVLDHSDIYGTAGLPGSTGHEVRHGDYRVHGLA